MLVVVVVAFGSFPDGCLQKSVLGLLGLGTGCFPSIFKRKHIVGFCGVCMCIHVCVPTHGHTLVFGGHSWHTVVFYSKNDSYRKMIKIITRRCPDFALSMQSSVGKRDKQDIMGDQGPRPNREPGWGQR